MAKVEQNHQPASSDTEVFRQFSLPVLRSPGFTGDVYSNR